MFCPKCGTKNENTNFCVSCGAQLPKPKAAATVATQPSRAVPNQNQAEVKPNNTVVNPKPTAAFSPQPAFNQKKVQPKVKPAKPSMPSEPIFTKENMLKWGFCAILAVLYICISVLFITSFGMKKAITLSSAFNGSFEASITLEAFLKLLIKGNKVFNPTILSTTLGVLTNILFWSVPVFSVLALAESFSKKGNKIFNIFSSIISSLSAVFLALIVPICVNYIPNFKSALSVKTGIIAEDITNVTFTTFIIHAVVVIVFVAATVVISSILNKRRQQK